MLPVLPCHMYSQSHVPVRTCFTDNRHSVMGSCRTQAQSTFIAFGDSACRSTARLRGIICWHHTTFADPWSVSLPSASPEPKAIGYRDPTPKIPLADSLPHVIWLHVQYLITHIIILEAGRNPVNVAPTCSTPRK